MESFVIADRNTIAETFKTDSLTTHRILQNLSFGFFTSFFSDAQTKWEEAHTFNGEVKFYLGINIEWLKNYVQIFGENQFTTCSDWMHKKDGSVKWENISFYRKEKMGYEK